MSTQTDTRTQSLQLGVQKYLYTSYFVGGVIVAWLVHNIVERVWEGHDAIATLIGVVAGFVAVVWAWRNERFRTISKEIIDELAAVSWPTKQETQTATFIVLVTSIVAAGVIFFMDRFWGAITEWIIK
ncbi:MAG: preprotein translocase subunit SecE [Myxococcales bacterium]|nr:preprotein translocase subunit SecE [Myxococcales bacterium]